MLHYGSQDEPLANVAAGKGCGAAVGVHGTPDLAVTVTSAARGAASTADDCSGGHGAPLTPPVRLSQASSTEQQPQSAQQLAARWGHSLWRATCERPMETIAALWPAPVRGELGSLLLPAFSREECVSRRLIACDATQRRTAHVQRYRGHQGVRVH